MKTQTETIMQPYLKTIPDIQPGDTIRVHQKLKEANKERIQVFEGVVLARKHGKGVVYGEVDFRPCELRQGNLERDKAHDSKDRDKDKISLCKIFLNVFHS